MELSCPLTPASVRSTLIGPDSKQLLDEVLTVNTQEGARRCTTGVNARKKAKSGLSASPRAGTALNMLARNSGAGVVILGLFSQADPI